MMCAGDAGDYFYVIESGTYEVFKTVDGESKKVFEYKEAGSFGELALMYNCPRAATVKVCFCVFCCDDVAGRLNGFLAVVLCCCICRLRPQDCYGH